MMNEVITMATFLVLGLPTLLGAGFLVVFYIALSRDSVRKRRRSHPPYEVFVAFKLDESDQPDEPPAAVTSAPRVRAVSTADRLRVRRVHAA
jgi:hypothetical protein